MVFDLEAALPLLAPRAIAWSEAQSSSIAASGLALRSGLIDVARRAGVSHPERIRLLEVDQLPLPEDKELKDAALAMGLLGSSMVGLTLGYSVCVCRGYCTMAVLAHEFRHVFQYEQAGSIAVFLVSYLQQISAYGYAEAPYELDARAFEREYQ